MNEMDKNARDVNDGLFPYNGDQKHQLAFLVNYAILAPSHYNAQPWKFKLSKTALDVYLDRSKVSRFVDPDAREAVISCGAAISVMEVAAHYFGLNVDVNLDVDEQSAHIAQLTISGDYDPSEKDDAMFHAIKRRQTNRNWFSDVKIPDVLLAQLHQVTKGLDVQLLFNKDKKTSLSFSELTKRAVQLQFKNPWFRIEFASWQRSSFSLQHDGITGFGFFRRVIPYPLARPLLRQFGWGAATAKYNYDKCQTGSPVFAVFSTEDDDKIHWINTGRALSSVLLLLTTHQLSASFMNQAIQEPDLRKQLPHVFGCADKPQLVLRIGKAAAVQWTPRRPVKQTLM